LFAPAIGLSLIACFGPVHALQLQGRVATADGQAISGALVTVWNEATDSMEMVYTVVDGTDAIRSGQQGIVWFTVAVSNHVVRFDPKTKSLENVRLPLLAANEQETPCALNIHPTTGEACITSNMSHHILHFNPVDKAFVADPGPPRVAWPRDLVFAKQGQVCPSSSSLPAQGLEDGRDAFICLDPTGGKKERLALTQH
jgi:virginiamycin B lyase